MLVEIREKFRGRDTPECELVEIAIHERIPALTAEMLLQPHQEQLAFFVGDRAECIVGIGTIELGGK